MMMDVLCMFSRIVRPHISSPPRLREWGVGREGLSVGWGVVGSSGDEERTPRSNPSPLFFQKRAIMTVALPSELGAEPAPTSRDNAHQS